MDLLHNLALGFSVLADPMTIVYSLIGVVCGVIIARSGAFGGHRSAPAHVLRT